MTRAILTHGIRWRLQSLGMSFGLWAILLLQASEGGTLADSTAIRMALLVLTVWLALAAADMVLYGMNCVLRASPLGDQQEDESA